MQHRPVISPPTPVQSLQPTAREMVSPGMVPHGVTHPQATMPPILPTLPMPPYVPCIPLDGAIVGGGGHYGMMPGQYVNQIQMARPGGMEMNMVQPALPHMISSYNPAMGAGVHPFFLPEPSSSQPFQAMGGGGPQGVSSRPPAIGPGQLKISPSQYNLDTPTLPQGDSK